MPAKRPRSKVNSLLDLRGSGFGILDKSKDLLDRSAALTETMRRIPTDGDANADPWKKDGAADQSISALSRITDELETGINLVTHLQADAQDEARSRVAAGQTKTAALRRAVESPVVLQVRRYCKDRGLPFTKRKLSQLIHQDLGIPLRNVQRALQTINKK
jgi:hypothetical protein